MTLQPPSLKNRKHLSRSHQAPALGGGERAPIEPYSDEDLELNEEEQAKVERLMEFFDHHGIDYDKFDPSKTPRLDFGKKDAYPNFDQYMHIPGQHDTQKWLQAISDIYRKERNGENRVIAIRQVTSGWNVMETHDFLNWVKFHESGDHMKYKFAQLWYENPALPGYALPVKKDPEPTPQPRSDGPAIDFAAQRATEDAERRDRIEKQRSKIIGRLDSAEKLLRSPDGHMFSGREFETLLEAIYQLKKRIQMVNKISTSTRLYEDMIVREANVLRKNGFNKAASLLWSVAQTPGQSGEQAEGSPDGSADLSAAPPPDPSGAGNPGPPSGGAATPAQPPGGSGMPQSEPNNPPAPKGITEFLANLDESQVSGEEDRMGAEDELEVLDTDDALFVTEAQVAPEAPAPEPLTTAPAPAPLKPSPVAAPDAPAAPEGGDEPPLEVSEEDLPPPGGDKSTSEPSASNFNAKMDAVLKGVTISDVVAELEDLSKIFKTREIPRRLGRVDMMFDALGIATYFPSLSEATNKSLEANNYIATRVDDILSKLRGALATKDVDLKGEDDVDRPDMAGVKQNLQQSEDKEKERKKMRKEQENAELENKGKETPEVEIEEDLGEPTAPPAAPARPAAPPTA
jgi:hypothetical protein